MGMIKRDEWLGGLVAGWFVFCILAIYLDAEGVGPVREFVISAEEIRPREGGKFEWRLPSEKYLHPGVTRWATFYEGERERTAARVVKAQDRRVPSWSLRKGTLVFATEDGTDPRNNGRVYVLRVPAPLDAEVSRSLLVGGGVLLGGLWAWKRTRRIVAGVFACVIESWRRRRPWWMGALVAISFTMILCSGAMARIGRVPFLLLSPDSPGYLAAVVDAKAGGGLGIRSWVYPTLLRAFVGFGDDLNQIVTWQLAGNFLAACTMFWLLFSVGGRTPVSCVVACVIGILLVSASSFLHWEAFAMGESISFPLMAWLLFSVWRGLAMEKPQGQKSIWAWWMSATLCSVALYYIKPNWGGGLFVPLLVIPWFVCQLATETRRQFVLGGVCLALFGATLMGASLIDRSQKSKGAQETGFLSSILFLWHLNQISPLIEEDLRGGALTDKERLALNAIYQAYQADLRRIQSGEKTSFKNLGYDPDVLMWDTRTGILVMPEWLAMTPAARSSMQKRYFLRALCQNPGGYLRQVLRELWIYYGDSNGGFSNRHDSEVQEQLKKSLRILSMAGLDRTELGGLYDEKVTRWLESPGGRLAYVYHHPVHLQTLSEPLRRGHHYLCLVASLIAVHTLWIAKRAGRAFVRLGWFTRVAVLQLFTQVSIFAVLGTMAAIHSLSVGRYLEYIVVLNYAALGLSVLTIGMWMWPWLQIGIRAAWSLVLESPGTQALRARLAAMRTG